ncbi:hypothetical protein MSG28_016207 [Choristoneura fumiferana]|uniref:Uncharacterized protein n=1 Tax=Choristoneura fumiferana TaxID=7141 RepID=A0ACC0K5N9_CHOFU|nr:hypothetical protein MSG28_016207 [Choristoneura fumiferana]
MMLRIMVLVSVITPIIAENLNESKNMPNTFTKKPISESTNSDVFAGITNRQFIDKLVSSIFLSKRRIDFDIKRLDAMQNLNKSKNMYRIGYLISFINKLQMRVSGMYRIIEENKYKLDTMQLLKVYEEVIYSSNFITSVLTVLTEIMSSQITGEVPLSNMDRFAPPQTIAWSYYDDSLM